MALSSGARLGPYSIDYPLGSGGMGEVYCATDTTLSRQVAIKVLPEGLASDAERLARFDREARTLAALNHPNIAAIYGVERSGTSFALVMELVEGPTLADRITQGAIPLDEAIALALQIAKALETAHEQGIVHRDLKPANIKVRPDGTVKVLDFGLAKALGPETMAAAGNATLSPTITSPAMMTGVGIILGTAAYMSPEQARGKAVDKRADIWAFGAVMFEMLTGERAFAGEDVSDTLADVMRVEPAWGKLPDGTPPALVTFLKRCLRKNPAERTRDIGDMRLALEGAFDTAVTAAAPNAAVPATPARPAFYRRALLLASLPAIAAAAAAAAWHMKPVETRPVVKLSHALPEGRGFRGTGRALLAVSPDGRQIVYNATGGLYLRSVDAIADRLIPGTESAVGNPVFSPDGQALAFYQVDRIRRISLAGGASVPIAAASNPLGMTWDPDGSILYSQRDGIWQVPATGGDPKRRFKSDETRQYVLPQRLPGGEWILATAFRPSTSQDEDEVVALSLATGEQRVVRKGAAGGTYAPTGHLLYVNNGVLYAAPFDATRLTVTGGAVSVVEGVRPAVGLTALAQFVVSPAGTMAFVPGPTGTAGIRWSLATADAVGAVTPVKGLEAGPYGHVRATRDGKQVAVESDDGKEAFVSIYDLGGSAAMRRLTFGGRNTAPAWSPNGKRVAFQSDRDGDAAIYVQNADGTGAVERLTRPQKGDVHVPESWSPDGRYLSFAVVNARGFSLWLFSFADRKTTQFRDLQGTEPFGSVFSPDGKWIAYHLRPSDTAQNAPAAGVFVEPFPPTGAQYQAPRVNFDFQPVWSHDGSELLYLPSTASGRMARVRFSTRPTVTFGMPSTFPFTLTANQLSGGRRAFDVLPNGNLVSLSGDGDAPSGVAGATEFRIVVNWFDELRRLAPTH